MTRAYWVGNGEENWNMNKKEIYALLSTRKIWYEVTEHKAVYNMAEVAEIRLPYPEADAKNLFIFLLTPVFTVEFMSCVKMLFSCYINHFY